MRFFHIRKSLAVLMSLAAALFFMAMPVQNAKAAPAWSRSGAFTTDTIWDVAYGNGCFIAVSYENGEIYKSTDLGDTWIVVERTEHRLSDIAFGNNTFVATDLESETVFYSDNNGGTWHETEAGHLGVGLVAICYGDLGFMAVGGDSPYTAAVYISQNGSTWTDTFYGAEPETGNDFSFYNVAYGNGTYVAGSSNKKLFHSSNGTDWRLYDDISPDPTASAFTGVEYGNGLFVAAADTGSIFTSNDNGSTWTARFESEAAFYDIAYCGDRFYAVASGGVMYSSLNGTEWTAVVTGTTTNLWGIGYGGGQVIVTGDAGTLLLRAPNSNASLNSVLGQTDSSVTGAGSSGSPYTWGINVSNAVSSLSLSGISAASYAAVNLYTDSDFTNEITGSATIALAQGGTTTAYIKITSENTLVTSCYAVQISRAAPPDTTAPHLTAGTVSRTGDANATVSFTTDEAGQYYYVVVNDGEIPALPSTSGAGTACSAGENSIVLSALSAGAKDIYILVKDAANNVSTALKMDISAYVPPDLTEPHLAAGSVSRTSDANATVAFTTDEAGQYYYSVVSDGDAAPTLDTTDSGIACSAGEATITLSTLTAGAKDIYIQVKDAANNVSTALKIDIPAYIAPDLTAPHLTAGSVSRTSDANATVVFTTDEAGQYYYVVVNDGEIPALPSTSGAGTACSAGENSIVLSALSAGAKDIYIQVKDAANNVSTALKMDIPVYVPPDLTEPHLTAGSVSRTSDANATVAFTTDEAGQYYYSVVSDGDAAPTLDTTDSGIACSAGEATITLSTLTAGAKDIYIQVKDAANNVSTALKIDIPAYIAPDLTAPHLTAGTVNRTSDANATVAFTTDEAGQYYYSVVSDGDTAPTLNTTDPGITCSAGEATITFGTLTAGAKDIYIQVKDASNNVSTALKIDIPAYIAPDLTAPNLTAGTVSRISDANATVAFTTDEAGQYYYSVVSDGDTAPTLNTTDSGIACSVGEATITLGTLTAGAKDIYIQVKDASNNVSAALKIDIPAYIAPDLTAPHLTVGTVNRTSDANATVAFTTDEAGQYYYSVVSDGDAAPTLNTTGSGIACSAGEVTITLGTLTAGAKDIYIQVKDASNNVSTALKIDIPAYIAPDLTAPNLTAGTVSRISDAGATVTFTTDEAGQYYYSVVSDGDAAPTLNTTGSGIACSAGEVTITLGTLTAGAKDIYIQVKDAANNVSTALKIDIPAYIAPDLTAPHLTAGTVNRTSDANATVAFTTDEAGKYYYAVVGDGDAAPTLNTGDTGIACSTGEATITLSTLTAGAKDIYIQVKDAANNVSDVLRIEIPDVFVPVTGILGVPASAAANVDLTLSGTVEPAGATNQSIVWSLKEKGTTGAALSGTTLSTLSEGTVTVTATVAHGVSPAADYTQDFEIPVYIMSHNTLEEQVDTTTVLAQGLIADTAQLIVVPIPDGAQDRAELEQQLTEQSAIAAYEVHMEPAEAFRPPLNLTFQVGEAFNGRTVYILHRLSDGNTDVYTPTVTNGQAVITVNELSPFLLAVDPQVTITAQPQSTLALAGQTAAFHVAAEGLDPLSYRWQRRANAGASWEDIPGATEPGYTTTALNKSHDGYQYRVIVTDMLGNSATSDMAVLTVTRSPETGDASRPFVYAAMAVLFAAVSIFIMRKRIKA